MNSNKNKLIYYFLRLLSFKNYSFIFYQSVNGTVVQEMQLEGLEDYILKENDTIFLSDSLTGVQLQLCVDECNEISRYQSLSKLSY